MILKDIKSPLWFGKHKGLTLEQITRVNPSYVVWLATIVTEQTQDFRNIVYTASMKKRRVCTSGKFRGRGLTASESDYHESGLSDDELRYGGFPGDPADYGDS